eukprot:CFRG3244T1
MRSSSLLSLASLSVVIPTVTTYSDSLGAGNVFSGLVVGTYGISAAIFLIPMTALLRKTAFKPVLILCCFTGIVGHALYALAGLANLKIGDLVALMVVFCFKEPSTEYKAYENLCISRTKGTNWQQFNSLLQTCFDGRAFKMYCLAVLAVASAINLMWEVSIQHISSKY